MIGSVCHEISSNRKLIYEQFTKSYLKEHKATIEGLNRIQQGNQKNLLTKVVQGIYIAFTCCQGLLIFYSQPYSSHFERYLGKTVFYTSISSDCYKYNEANQEMLNELLSDENILN